LKSLLAVDVHISGPLGGLTSSAAYFGGLALDSPIKYGYSILSVTQNTGSASVFWRYEKPGKPLLIGQLFRIWNGWISEILMVFDTKNFKAATKNGQTRKE